MVALITIPEKPLLMNKKSSIIFFSWEKTCRRILRPFSFSARSSDVCPCVVCVTASKEGWQERERVVIMKSEDDVCLAETHSS